MSAMTAMGMAAEVAEGGITLEGAVTHHLQSNHYPPVPVFMVKPCLEAVQKAKSGDVDSMIDLPNGVTYRGSKQVSVDAIVNNFHLEPFIWEVE